MKPYTDEEIQAKLEITQRQITGFTHGLLEVTTNSEPLFCSRSIQFFHRTARDFVLENAHLQKFHAESPGLTSLDTYLRLYIAQLWFSRPGTKSHCVFPIIWVHLDKEVSDHRLLPALAKARAYHNTDLSPWTFPGRKATFNNLSSRASHPLPPVPESQLHYIINSFPSSEYIRSVVSEGHQLLEERDGLSCLLSAVIDHYIPNLESVQCLLGLGKSPRQLVPVHYDFRSYEEDTSPDTRETYVPVWSVLLIYVVQACTWSFSTRRGHSYYGMPVEQAIWDVVELLLKYGGYGNSFFLLVLSENPSVPVYVISLQELIRQYKPLNEEALLQLIDKDVPSSFHSRLKKLRIIRRRSSETPFDPAQYKPFHLSMLEDSKDKYGLYSVWSAGCETKAQGITFRIY
jgi:hypothetical protein